MISCFFCAILSQHCDKMSFLHFPVQCYKRKSVRELCFGLATKKSRKRWKISSVTVPRALVTQVLSVCDRVSQCVTVYHRVSQCITVYHTVSQCVTVYHRVSQCITVCLSVSQSVTVLCDDGSTCSCQQSLKSEATSSLNQGFCCQVL